MARLSRETFICPGPVSRIATTLPGRIINHCMLMRLRSPQGCAFVPIRSMQFLAVITDGEVLFVDHQGGYAVEDGVGGRLVALGWELPAANTRDSLSESAAVHVVGYRDDFAVLHQRIMSEFPRALRQCRGKHAAGGDQARVLVCRGEGRDAS